MNRDRIGMLWGIVCVVMGLGLTAMAGDYVASAAAAYPPGVNYPGSRVAGTYIVPAPAQFSRYASWETGYGLNTDSDGKLTIDYCLPEDVVGPDAPHIHLKETGRILNGLHEFLGEHGHGSCYESSRVLTCFVVYPGFPIDKAKVATLLRQKYGQDTPADESASQAELMARLQIADLFSADPKGVIYVTRQ